MNADINTAQSKSITIVFALLRLSFLIYNAAMVFLWHQDPPSRSCSQTALSYGASTRFISLIMMGISAFVLLIMVCGRLFRKLLFYLYYIGMVIMTVYLMITSGLLVRTQDGCQSAMALGYMTLFACAAINLMVLCVIALPFELAMKGANLGACIVWPVYLFMYERLLGVPCHETSFANIIAWVHLILLVVGYFTFTLLKLTYKTTFVAKVWRTIMLLSVLLMAGCFAMSWLARLYSPNLPIEHFCTFERFFLRTYQRHGWVEMLAPILLMTFVRFENGDIVRENDLKFTWAYPQPFIAPPV